VVECLLSIHEVLVLISSTKKEIPGQGFWYKMADQNFSTYNSMDEIKGDKGEIIFPGKRERKEEHQ
jgi:hypothetical protein